MSIYDEVLSFINNPRPDRFEPLALAVFRFQFDQIPVYRQFCMARGAAPETVSSVSQIPAASTLAFKHTDVRSAAATHAFPNALTFTTSGTTKGFTERGRHHVPHPEIYRASALAHLRRMLFPDRRRLAILALHPTADRMPESSLSTMLSWCIEEFGQAPTLCAATRARLDSAAALEFLDDTQARHDPVCILGTTAASAALFEAVAQRGRILKLAPGSRLMDTGGAKGQVVPLTPAEVIDRAHATLGIDPALVINEYGMTEMCSQLYDVTPFNSPMTEGGAIATPLEAGQAQFAPFTLASRDSAGHPAAPTNLVALRVKLAPPWLRPTVLDPVTLLPLEDGRVGLLTFFDLANVGSISALMTEDFGIVNGDTVSILGRAAAGGARGCALGIDQFASHELRPRSLNSKSAHREDIDPF